MKLRLVLAAAMALPLLAGCYHYKPRPLDTGSQAAMFLARTADGEQVSALAARLRETPEHR